MKYSHSFPASFSRTVAGFGFSEETKCSLPLTGAFACCTCVLLFSKINVRTGFTPSAQARGYICLPNIGKGLQASFTNAFVKEEVRRRQAECGDEDSVKRYMHTLLV